MEKPLVIIPDGGQELIRAELAEGFAGVGYTALRVAPAALEDAASPHFLPRLLDKKPALFVSVNMQGLFAGRRHIASLLDNGVQVLCWFVDNPWNVLSAARDPSWKDITLAVTDKSFIAPLQNAGAAKVFHLPLAASKAAMQVQSSTLARNLRRVVFAGRLAFPAGDSFFAGESIDEVSLAAAYAEEESGCDANFNWWCTHLGLEQATFWPGKKARRPSLGAVLANKYRRERYASAFKEHITIFGGKDWLGLGFKGQGMDMRGNADYYLDLPAIYASAEFTLNLNSLILNAGLSQRAFDVWQAGGFCLTDKNAGMEIFPADLAKAVSFASPEEALNLQEELAADPKLKEDLRHAWQDEISAHHSYGVRVRQILASCTLA